MAIELLPSTSAFSKGADLWIISDNSNWLNKLDWYTSLMISKYKNREVASLSADNYYLLNRCGYIHETHQHVPSNKLMLIVDKFFPNQSILILTENDLKNWADTSLKLWTNLNYPNVRFFLPPGVNNNDFLSYWPQDLLGKDYLYKVSLISDLVN